MALSDTTQAFSLTRNGAPLVTMPIAEGSPLSSERPLVSELQGCGFLLESREPDTEYRITIGDLDASEAGAHDRGLGGAGGVAFGTNVLWPEGLYFESARGRVRCRLWSRGVGSADPWALRATLSIEVVPTKLGEFCYLAMFEDLRALASGLVFELVSKAVRGTGFKIQSRSVAFRGSHVELRLIDQAWQGIAPALAEADAAPATRFAKIRMNLPLSKTHRIDSRTLRGLVSRGVDPRARAIAPSLHVPVERLLETGDTRENRIVLFLVRSLLARCEESLRGVDRHIESIESDRGWRDIGVGDGPTLYDSFDKPRLGRLRAAQKQGRRLRSTVATGAALSFLKDLAPLDAPMTGPTFEHVRPYRRIRAETARYFRSSLILMEDGGEERIKSTSRMYEQWVFLQLAAAFRAGGLECQDIRGLVRAQGRNRFVLDIDRGTTVTFKLDPERILRLRYEPWILPASAARGQGDSVYRGRAGETAWSPDVFLEVLGPADQPVPTRRIEYAIVVDAKYTARLDERHWRRTSHYLEIRDVRDDRQVVKQLWLAHPGRAPGIIPRDAAVTWSRAGPDRPREEVIQGILSIRPPETSPAQEISGTMEPVDTALDFAIGLLRYLGIPEPSVGS